MSTPKKLRPRRQSRKLHSKPLNLEGGKQKRPRTKQTRSGLVRASARLLPDKRNARTEALKRLGLVPEDVSGLTIVSHVLEQAENGIEQVIEAIRGNDSEDARAFIEKYDSVSSSDLRRVSLEAISHAAGVPPVRLLEIATSSLFNQQQAIGAIIAATAHPLVIKKTVQMALTDRGIKDREMLHAAQGFTPTPKGATTINRIQIANVGGPPETPDVGTELEEVVSDKFPSLEDDLHAFHAAHMGSPALLPPEKR